MKSTEKLWITFVSLLLILFIVLLANPSYYTYLESFSEKQKPLEQQKDEKKESFQNIQPVPVIPYLQRDPYQLNALDRVYNPLRYPYKSEWTYERDWYPDQQYSPQVVGCGGRNQPCAGGSQTIIPNYMVPVEMSERNIAPVTMMPIRISTRGPLGEPQQVGVIMKIFGDENTVYPLFGRKKYPRQDLWEYYTTIGPFGAKVPILRQRQGFQTELQTNDVVMIHGQHDKYRVTIYETDFPQYIPY
jgi:hypothetical protein